MDTPEVKQDEAAGTAPTPGTHEEVGTNAQSPAQEAGAVMAQDFTDAQQPVTFLDGAGSPRPPVDITEAYPGGLTAMGSMTAAPEYNEYHANGGLTAATDELQHWLEEIHTVVGHAHVEVRDTARNAVAKLRELLHLD